MLRLRRHVVATFFSKQVRYSTEAAYASKLANAKTIPASAYVKQEVFERERHEIFAKEWQMVGFEQQLAEPGQYVASEFAGFRIFIIKDRHGKLNAFHNVCRHRAGPLVTDSHGQCDVLRCKYHGWTYDTNGTLKVAPHFGDAQDFDKKDFGLIPVRVETWNGIMWINLDMKAKPLQEELGNTWNDVLSSIQLPKFSHCHSVHHMLNVNWKVYTDNYQEGYHIPAVHPSLNKAIDFKNYNVVTFDKFCKHVVPAKQGDDKFLWIWRYPNNILNIYEHHMSMERVIPVAPNKTRIELLTCFAHVDRNSDGTAKLSDKQLASINLSKAVVDEDLEICVPVQQNLESGIYDTGRLSPRHENGVFFFHELYRQSMKM